MESQYCSFYMDELYYGISVNKIQEILQNQEISEVPLSSPLVCGLINLRGQIICAIDLRLILELPQRKAESPVSILILDSSMGLVGLVIDEVDDVIYVSEDEKESPPKTLMGNAKELISQTYKCQKHLLLIIDTEKTLQLALPEKVS